MEINKRNIGSKENDLNSNSVTKIVRVGNYECETTNVPNVFKILSHKGGFLARCNYGKVEKINKKMVRRKRDMRSR